MNIEKAIEELFYQGIIQSKTGHYEVLPGGTSSRLYLLQSNNNSKYVVKFNEPEVLKAEAAFLNYYDNLSFIPTLLYVEHTYHYIFYSFISGTTKLTDIDKQLILKTLAKEVLNQYKNVGAGTGFGFIDAQTASWSNFLREEIREANKVVSPYLAEAEHDFVLSIFKVLETNYTKREPFLLHGDCGVHNFIFNGGELIGVIDPTPVIGYPLYDLIYAFCSSPDELTKNIIDMAVSHLTVKSEAEEKLVYEMVIIVLYLRLGACIKHHPHDFGQYLEAWFYWKNIYLTAG